LQAAPGTDLAAVKASLEGDDFLKGRVDIYFEDTYWDKFGKTFRQITEVMQLVSLVALFAIVFGIFNVVSMTVAEKRREIGVLRAVGLSQGEVLGIYLLEGLLQAGLGFLAGLGLGAGFVWWLANYGRVNLLSLSVLPVLTPGAVILALGLTGLLALVGSYLSARKATRMAVVEALREL
jgi:ABC-type antimicrobial peptide transport system permease subunit